MPLSWHQHHPHSQQYQDVYFAPEDGLAESEYVFLHGNQLPERWSKHSHWTIAETGFGTGLNFFMTWHHLPKTHQLTFISFEQHPLSLAQIRYALTPWPTLTPYLEQFASYYPHLFISPQTYSIALTDRITLELHIGPIETQITTLNTSIDAWYLDGFAPKKNPEMWSPHIFQNIARTTKSQGTFATFTASRIVQDTAKEAGFIVTKRKGFGKKREMLTGAIHV